MLGAPKKTALAALLIVVAAVLGACGDGEDRPGEASASGSGSGSGSASGSASASGAMDHETTAKTIPASEAEVTVDVTMSDFKFEGIPSTIDGHKILFKAKNDGPTEHELVILKGTKELAEIEGIDAGKTGELALELEPGKYTAACHIGSGGARHDKLGMVVNFTVA
jgi:uncharacterized cupredoxin-like copper-binding protein